MNLKKPVRQSKGFKDERNKFIVWLIKVRKWKPIWVTETLEAEYNHKISKQRVSQIFGDYKKLYPRSIYKNYNIPDKI